MQETSYLPWLVVLCPLIGFLINAFAGARLTKSPKPVVETGPIVTPYVSPYAMDDEDDEEPQPREGEDADGGHGHGHGAFPLNQAGMRIVGALATLVIAAGFGLSLMLFFQVMGMAGEERRLFSVPFEWMQPLGVTFQLAVDPLSALMLLIITGIGTLIHLYSTGYMSHDVGYARYFTYLNLFVFFMLLLVMGANLPLLFVGWEGVGLASYLLIGFYYQRTSATNAGKKAFIVNRIGDCALLIALFALYKYFGTLNFYGADGILSQANALLSQTGEPVAMRAGYALDGAVHWVPLLLMLGAAGKSAQIPLYVWLPDAMEGPTPVSALIHAATMVTGGVYLVSRMHALFLLSDTAMTVVAVVGVTTAFLAALIALTQNDIKKVLAYSTVSQLGYMFLACGVGAFGTAMFHVTTHAFFKALLFLGSGSVIHAMSGEQDMRKMGGLRRKLPITSLTMFIGTLAIAGIPGFAGFFSKDEILANAYAGPDLKLFGLSVAGTPGGLGSPLLFVSGWIVAVLTAFYMTRLMMKTFGGTARYSEATAKHIHESPISMTLPLGILALLSIFGGFMGGFKLFDLPNYFEGFLGETVEWRGEASALAINHTTETILVVLSVLAAIGGMAYAFARYRNSRDGNLLAESRKRTGSAWDYSFNKFYVDEFYHDKIVGPGLRASQWLWRTFDSRVLDGIVNGTGGLVRSLGQTFTGWQSGYVRNYALSMFIGVLIVVLLCLIGLRAGLG